MKKKSLILTIIFITIINTILPVANAAQIITKANLTYDHKIDSHIQYYNQEREEWRDIQCGYICYKIDGQRYPAYCISHGLNGVDEEGPYAVTINDLLKDKLIYNTILNGYPYKTPAQLGVETADDAYVATKHAINTVLLNRDVKTFYKAADARGEKIIDAIYNISEKGKAGNKVNKAATLSVNKIGDLVEKGEYYYQEYTINADVNISDYTIESLSNFSKECFVADTNGEKKKEFSSNQNFRVMIHKKDLNKNISGKINITASCNTSPIFYGEAPNNGIQDYAVTYKPYAEYKVSVGLNENTNTSSIKVIKKDKETSKPIAGVSFNLYKDNDEYISTQKTDSNGIAIFNNLYQGTYKLKEIEANQNYVKDDTEYEITTEYNKQITKTITNVHKKGNLKITKIDKDENDVVLEGIEFDLIDSNKNKIAHLVTDKNGEAGISNINIGKYTLKETKTKENYNLCIDNDIEVKWNETSEITIENEKKKGQIKVIKQDKENSEIKLEGVEFQIIDNNNRIVDKIKTDKNGVAITSRLPIGEYIIKETSLGTNSEYILNEEEYKIVVEDEKISEIVIGNEHKKGNLKIIKVDKDNPDLTLGAIEFDLIDENGKVIAHLTTDVNGEVEIKNINTGTYTLKETKTKREYNLCENEDIVVEWNKTSETVIENEKKKGQIKIIKEDKDKNEIKLAGVKFQILDKRDNVIEEIETNDKGEAISSRILIGEYKIKEISLGNNDNYLLNNEIYNIQVEDEKISEIVIQNEHKKGNLKIVKVDKDNNNVFLEGVRFEITDKDGFKYEAVSNKNGIAEVENIRIGKVKIKEVATNKEYVLPEEVFETVIEYNKISEIIIQNEKKKGQVEIYKTDKENKDIKISDVEFVIFNKDNNIVDRIATNKEGYARSKRLPIGEYYLKETKTNDKYVLNEEIIKIEIKEDEVLSVNVENEKIKGRIQIIKSSSKDSPILNIKKGDYLSDVVFEIFNEKGELVDTVVTDGSGQALSKELEIGRYKVKEKTTNQYYILSTNELIVNIEKDNEIKILNIENEPVIPVIDIEKTGQQFAEKNEEIKYEFDIKNISNTSLDNFTWTEYIPYQSTKVTKIVTGIYNENLDYEIYYKTNQNDYRLFKKVNSCTSEYLNFDVLNLAKGELITEIKVEYETVSKDFSAIVKPVIFTKINDNVKKDDRIVNITELSGIVEDYVVKDKSSFETIITEKEKLKKLPKTGC